MTELSNCKACHAFTESETQLVGECAFLWPSQAVQWWRICLPMQETQERWVQSLGQQDPLEEELTIHSSILAWKIPWREELGGLQSMWSQESDTTEWLSTHALYFSTFSCKIWWSHICWGSYPWWAGEFTEDQESGLLPSTWQELSNSGLVKLIARITTSPRMTLHHVFCPLFCFQPLETPLQPTPALKHSSRPGSGGFWVVSLCDQLNIRWTLVLRITQEERLFNNPIPLLPAEVRSLSCRFFLKGCPGWFTGAAS